MPQPVAKEIKPAPVVQGAHVVVDVEVGDVANLRDFDASRTGARSGAADFQRAEACGEIAQLRVGETLVAKNQDCVLVNGGPQGGDGGCVDRLGQIEA